MLPQASLPLPLPLPLPLALPLPLPLALPLALPGTSRKSTKRIFSIQIRRLISSLVIGRDQKKHMVASRLLKSASMMLHSGQGQG